MAREHRCPNCGPQPCNASTSKIHTCGVCAAIWEEDLSVPVPGTAPAPPASAAAAPVAVPPKPASPATASAPAAPSPPTAARPAAAPPASASTAAPAPPRASAPPASLGVPSPTPPPKPVSPSAPGGAKTLADVLQDAKVKRCPKCESEGLAQPSDFLRVQGRLVLVDSQTYRAHQWYADSGDLLPAVAAPPPAPTSTAVLPVRSSPAS
jgi:hypothetical protein